MNYKVLTGRDISELSQLNDKHSLHPNTIAAFLKLKKLANKEIGAKIEVISSHRTFEKQLQIWNNKASGNKDLFDLNEKKINTHSFSKLELMKAILLWSAIPGGSRHHWGTDLDIFDANQIEASQVQLLNSECLPGGPCADLHLWLDEKIKQNQAFGFFRPYDTPRNNTGVGMEKWHISFSKLSDNYLSAYTHDIFIQNIKTADILLKDEILEHSQLIYENYILNIDKNPNS